MAILAAASVSKGVGGGGYPRAASTRTATPHFTSTFLSSLDSGILCQHIQSPDGTCSASSLTMLPSHGMSFRFVRSFWGQDVHKPCPYTGSGSSQNTSAGFLFTSKGFSPFWNVKFFLFSHKVRAGQQGDRLSFYNTGHFTTWSHLRTKVVSYWSWIMFIFSKNKVSKESAGT